MRKYYIVRKGDNSHENTEEHKNNLNKPATGTNKFWENEDYVAYVKKHGMHFNDKLAKWASSKMKNANGSGHIWSVSEVQTALKSMGYNAQSSVNNMTPGDLAYAANMYYADFVGDDFKDTDAIKMAYIIAQNPDGYVGMLFNRFSADIMKQNVNVPWKELI